MKTLINLNESVNHEGNRRQAKVKYGNQQDGKRTSWGRTKVKTFGM